MLTSLLRRPPGRKVFFLHLPKCAGSSLWQALRGLVGAKHMYQAYSADRFRAFAEMDPATRNSFRAIGGHFPLAGYQAHLDLSQYFAVTTLREPVERAISEYHYARNNPKHSEYDIIRRITLAEFIERNPNPVTTLISGKPDAAAAVAVVREVFDRWAFVDDLPDLLAAICRHLGRPVATLPRVNVGPRTLDAITVSADERALIRRLHDADVEFYRVLRDEHRRRAQPVMHMPRRRPVAVPGASEPPTFQIVTPTMNTARYLDEAIASVVGQEGDFRIRYHIQDGGSRDRTVAIARDWQARLASGAFKVRCRDVRLSVASHPDRGMYEAITTGFRLLAPAPDDYATYINGDDRLATGALATIADVFADLPAIELVGGRRALTDANGEPQVAVDLPRYARAAIASGLHDGRYLPFIIQEGTFWRAGLWQRTGGVDARFRYAGDWDLWRRFAGETDYVGLDTITGYHRRRPGQLSETLDAYYRELDAAYAGDDGARERLLIELQSAAPAVPVARRDASERWTLSEARAPANERALWPIDGDWLAGPGFGAFQPPPPDQGFAEGFYPAETSPAVVHVFSERAGERTLAVWLSGLVPDQAVAVSINGGEPISRTLRRAPPKSTCLEFRHAFERGPARVEISVDRRIRTAEGLRPGILLKGVGFWNGRPQISRLKRLLPKPLRAFV
jgi:glycosyltransferase involved in cell wall biosynthesis